MLFSAVDVSLHTAFFHCHPQLLSEACEEISVHAARCTPDLTAIAGLLANRRRVRLWK